MFLLRIRQVWTAQDSSPVSSHGQDWPIVEMLVDDGEGGREYVMGFVTHNGNFLRFEV